MDDVYALLYDLCSTQIPIANPCYHGLQHSPQPAEPEAAKFSRNRLHVHVWEENFTVHASLNNWLSQREWEVGADYEARRIITMLHGLLYICTVGLFSGFVDNTSSSLSCSKGGVGRVTCSLILQVKLVRPSLPRSSHVPLSVWSHRRYTIRKTTVTGLQTCSQE
jgi:hypothetical protein